MWLSIRLGCKYWTNVLKDERRLSGSPLFTLTVSLLKLSSSVHTSIVPDLWQAIFHLETDDDQLMALFLRYYTFYYYLPLTFIFQTKVKIEQHYFNSSPIAAGGRLRKITSSDKNQIGIIQIMRTCLKWNLPGSATSIFLLILGSGRHTN